MQLEDRWVGDQMSRREDAGLRNMSQRGWAPKPPVEQPRRTGKKRDYGHKSGGQYDAVLYGLQLPLTHSPFNKVRGRFFLKNCVARLYCVVFMILHTDVHVYAYVLCGYTTCVFVYNLVCRYAGLFLLLTCCTFYVTMSVCLFWILCKCCVWGHNVKYRKQSCLPLVESDPKAPFSTATTPRCRGSCYPFPWIALLYSRYVPHNAEC